MRKAVIIFIVCIMLGTAVPHTISAKTSIWDGSVASEFSSGNGSESSPYRITTADELAFLAEAVNNGNTFTGVYFELDADIFLNDTAESNWKENAKKWIPIGAFDTAFSGIFNGNGHTVSGLYITCYDSYVGLFGKAIEAKITNLGVINSFVQGSSSVGAIVGEDENCYFEACYSDCEIHGEFNLGGISGTSICSTFKKCYNLGNISGNKIVGGISGNAMEAPLFEHCYNVGELTVSSEIVGGIVGNLGRGSTTSSYNAGSINGNKYIGGIVGFSGGCSITDCYNIGAIKGEDSVGGIFGHATATMSTCYNSGEVNSTTNGGSIGGVITNYSYATYCYYLQSGTAKAFGALCDVTTAPPSYSEYAESLEKCKPLSLQEMKKKESFAGFDFDNVWTMGNDLFLFPVLSISEAVQFKLGDVNDNGEIDKYDYILVKRAVLNTIALNDVQKRAANVNEKDGVDKYDYILIKRHVLKTYTIKTH